MPTWLPKGPAPQFVPYPPPPNTTAKNVSGRVRALAFSPNYNGLGTPALFAGAAGGGIWRRPLPTGLPGEWSPRTDMMGIPLANSLIGLGAGMIDIGSIAVDINNPRLIYVGTGEGGQSPFSRYGSGILRSEDGGDTWSIRSYGPPTQSTLPILHAFFRHVTTKLLIDPLNSNVLYLALTVSERDPNTGTDAEKEMLGWDNFIYRSFDGGLTWSIFSTGIAFNPMTGDPIPIDVTDLEFIYSAALGRVYIFAGVIDGPHGKAGIWQWDNQTAAWNKLSNGLPAQLSDYQRVILASDHASGGSKIYAAIAKNDTTVKLFHSTDIGASWNEITPGQIGGQLLYNLALGRSPDGRVYLGGQDKVYQSDTSGSSGWTEIAFAAGNRPHPDHHAFAFSADGQTVYDANDGGVWTFTVSVGTWNDFNTGETGVPGLSVITCNAVTIKPTLNPPIALEGSQDNGVARTPNIQLALPTWTQRRWGDGGMIRFDKTGGSVYAYPDFGRSPNDGENWINLSPNLPQDTWPLYSPFALSRQTDFRMMIASATKLYESLDQGWTWKGGVPIFTLLDPSQVAALIYDGNSDAVAYLGMKSGRVYRGNRAGEVWTWVELSNGAGLWGQNMLIGGIDSSANVAGIVYLTIRHFTADPMDVGKRIWRSTNYGSAWNDITGDLPNLPVNTIMWAAENMVEVLYVGTDSGVYRRANPGDAGTPWEYYGDSLPNVQVVDLQYAGAGNASIFAAATHGRGVWAIQSPPP